MGDLDIQLDCGCCSGNVDEYNSINKSYVTPTMEKHIQTKLSELHSKL